ncbi:MAG TPA: glycosyl hydrolase family 18 protein [Polyangia bacterium]|jgi:GH18 family chitinase|nr:glycosyl hydrolase family 18 protein [Polyangia bacterium]
MVAVLPGCGGTVGGPAVTNATGGSNGSNGAGGVTSTGGASGSGGAINQGGAGGDDVGVGGAASGGAPGSGGAPASNPDGSVDSGPPATTGGTKVVMYLPNWSGSFASWATKMDFKKMTHLNLSFGTVKSNVWSLGAADADVKTLVDAAHAAKVKVLVSIGGADDDIGIINSYATAANIDPLVTSLDAFVTRLDLDGVDVDLERGAMMKSSGNFPAFLKALIAKLRPEGKLITSALAQYIVEDAGSDATITAWLNSYDFINLMIYSTNMTTYTKELTWWTTTKMVPKANLTWGVEFSSKLTVDIAKQLTTASEAYGGVMLWEYSQGTEAQLWPAVQGSI